MTREPTPSQLAVDIGIAVVCVAARIVIGVDGVAAAVLVLSMGTALAIRRFSPALGLAAVWIGVTVQLAATLPPDLSNLAILPLLYGTVRYGRAALKWAGLVSACLGAVIATVYLTGRSYAGDVEARPHEIASTAFTFFVAAAATFVLSWTIGLLVRTRSQDRENRRRAHAAEQIVAAEQERTRIARDMHDVVAHSLAVVIAQAEGARYAKASDPGVVDTALTAISTTARDALGDVRGLLAQLRRGEDAGPQPVLADLDRLFAQVRASGLRVSVRHTGDPAALPEGAQMAVYRIVQEALTNALRHGSTDEAIVQFDWQRDLLLAEISNDTTRPAQSRSDAASRESAGSPGASHGIDGMRERALLVGGRLSVAEEGGRFMVRLLLPITDGGSP